MLTGSGSEGAHCFSQDISGQSWVSEPILIVGDMPLRLHAADQPLVLVSQPSCVRGLAALDGRTQPADIPRRSVQRLLPQVHAQRLQPRAPILVEFI